MIVTKNMDKVRGERRYKRLDFYPEMLMKFFQPGLFLECVKGIPEYTDFKGMHWDTDRQVLSIIMENKEFEPVGEGCVIPLLDVEITGYWGKELQVIRKLIKSVKNTQEGENHG